MIKVLEFCRTTLFLGALCLFLLSTTIGAITWGLHTATTAAAATPAAVGTAVAAAKAKAHTRQAKAVMKTKTKSRIRCAVVVIPFLGAGASIYFEEQDSQEWKEENPLCNRQQYGCEVLGVNRRSA